METEIQFLALAICQYDMLLGGCVAQCLYTNSIVASRGIDVVEALAVGGAATLCTLKDNGGKIDDTAPSVEYTSGDERLAATLRDSFDRADDYECKKQQGHPHDAVSLLFHDKM